MPSSRYWPSPLEIEGRSLNEEAVPARLHDDHGPGTDGSPSGSSAAKPQEVVSCPERVPEPRSAPAEAHVREAGSVHLPEPDPAITLEAERAGGVPEYVPVIEAMRQLVSMLDRCGVYRA